MTTIALRSALCARPYPCQLADGESGLLLHVKDTTGLIAHSFIARCKGPEVLAFVQQHSAELIPGRCLDLQLTRLRAVGEQLRADVKHCSLAPLAPSWNKPQEPSTHHPQETPA